MAPVLLGLQSSEGHTAGSEAGKEGLRRERGRGQGEVEERETERKEEGTGNQRGKTGFP